MFMRTLFGLFLLKVSIMITLMTPDWDKLSARVFLPVALIDTACFLGAVMIIASLFKKAAAKNGAPQATEKG